MHRLVIFLKNDLAKIKVSNFLKGRNLLKPELQSSTLKHLNSESTNILNNPKSFFILQLPSSCASYENLLKDVGFNILMRPLIYSK